MIGVHVKRLLTLLKSASRPARRRLNVSYRRTVAIAPVPGRLRARLLAVFLARVEDGARIGWGARITNLNLELRAGAAVGRGARIDGLARVVVDQGAVIPAGAQVDTARPTTDGLLVIHHPVVVGRPTSRRAHA